MRSSRFSLGRLLDVLRCMEDKGQVPFSLDQEGHQLVSQVSPKFNGITFFDHESEDASIELDASLQGLGGVRKPRL